MEKIKFTEFANFQDKQKESWYTLLDPQCKYFLYGGAAGGGKSYFLRWTAVGLSMYYYAKYGIKNLPIGLFSEDYPTLRDRQVTKIVREFPSYLGTLKETQRDGLAFYVSDKYGGAVIMLRNLDDPSKYASVEFAAILVEELTKNKYETFEDLRTRMRFPGIEERKFIGATNPGQVGHEWVKRLWVKPDPDFLDEEQSRFRFVKALYSDNDYNPSDYALQLQSIKNPIKRKALLEGSWDIFAGQFFEEWRDELHTCRPFIPKKELVFIGGMDWGRAKPFAFYTAAIEKVKHQDGDFHRIWVFLEVYGTDKSPKEWSKEIEDKLKFYGLTIKNLSWVRCDNQIFNKGNDNSKSIADQFYDANPDWRGVLKPASKDRKAGWEIMHNWMSLSLDGLPYLIYSTDCTNAVRTIPSQVRDENDPEDLDSDGEDHAADASQYMLKYVKWIDAKSGGITHKQKKTVRRSAHMIDDKQLSVNTDRFAIDVTIKR